MLNGILEGFEPATLTHINSASYLRKRGYSWDPGNVEREKAWWIIVEDEDIELLWLKENVFGHDVRLPQKAVTALERFSSRVLVVE